jgi:CheY-like chemotaxis protein
MGLTESQRLSGVHILVVDDNRDARDILTTLLHEMQRRAGDHEARPYSGLATLCVGVGQGEATVVEWIN